MFDLLEGKRKLVVIIVVFVVLISWFYIQKSRPSDPSDIINKAISREITSYYLMLETSSIVNGADHKYSVKVWHMAPDNYRVEIMPCSLSWEEDDPEQIFVFDGSSTHIFNPGLGDYYQVPDSYKIGNLPFLLCNFMEMLANAREFELREEKREDGENFYIFKVVPEQTTYNYAWQELWLGKKSLLPRRLILYDHYDQPQQKILFHEVIISEEIDEDLFQIETAN